MSSSTTAATNTESIPELTYSQVAKLISDGKSLKPEEYRVFAIKYKEKECILKIMVPGKPERVQRSGSSSKRKDPARMEKEIRIYKHLAAQDCQVIPELMALIVEGGKPIGFICEKFDGVPPSTSDKDIAQCLKSLKQLHDCGVIHRDVHILNNVIMTHKGPRFFDFEDAELREGLEDFDKEVRNEIKRFTEDLE